MVKPSRQVFVKAEVDVVVDGSGIAGTFVAHRCGRAGLHTLLNDRLGTLGDNKGPGVVVDGCFAGEADVMRIGGHGISEALL